MNIQTLRYYERRGLLPEPDRRESGYRDYPADAVSVVRFIKRAQGLGFTLADVEELLHLADGGPDSCDAARELAAAKVADLEQRIAELQAMRNSLVRLADTCEQPRSQRDCPILHAIGNGNARSTP